MLSQLSVFISESEHVRFACFAASAQPPQQLWMPTSRLLCAMCGTFQLGAKISSWKKKKKTRYVSKQQHNLLDTAPEKLMSSLFFSVWCLEKKKTAGFFSLRVLLLMHICSLEKLWRTFGKYTHTQRARERERKKEKLVKYICICIIGHMLFPFPKYHYYISF